MDYDTLVDMHLITRQSFGNRPLFGTKRGGAGVDKDSAPFEWVTYKDFGKQVDRCRAALAGMGIVRGDTVGIISNNREEWAVCAYATYSLGAVFVPMYEEQVSKSDRGCTMRRERAKKKSCFDFWCGKNVASIILDS